MVNDGAVFLLGAEEDDLGVLGNGDGMAGGPVEQIATEDEVFRAVQVGYGDLAFDQIAPMGRLTEVVFESLEQGRDVDTGREGEVLAGDFAVACRIAKFGYLASYGARNVDLLRNIVLRDSHGGVALKFRSKQAIENERGFRRKLTLKDNKRSIGCVG